MPAADSPRSLARRHRVDRTRLALGGLLVVSSVLGVGALVHQADRSSVVLVARHVLAAGEPVEPADLMPLHVRLGSSADAYLAAQPSEGTVVTRTVEAGELVPRAALQSASIAATTSVVIVIDGPLAAEVVAGAPVDVWVSAEEDGGRQHGAPVVLVSGAVVVRIVRDDGFAGAGRVAVEVRVPRDATASVLAAMAEGDSVQILPAAQAAASSSLSTPSAAEE